MKKIAFCLWIVLLSGSCDDIFEKDISRKKVEIRAPGSGWVLEEEEQVFAWKLMEGASAYRLVIVSPSFDRIGRYAADTTVTGDHWIVALPDGQYQWSVRGCNSAYESCDTVVSFTVKRKAEGGQGL